MLEQNTLVFVEVRARSQQYYGDGAASVTRSKQQKLRKTAAHYLQRTPGSWPCRFDVLSVQKTEQQWLFDWIQGAFY
jgi:putative endonuclease